VTGGAVRLGRAISLELARQGYDLVLHYHSSARQAEEVAAEARQAGCQVSLVRGDLAAPEGPRQLGLAAGDSLDLLVNNAAVFYPTPTLEEAAAHWDHFLDVNLKAPFLCAWHCAAALRRRQGCIVNVVDIYARRPLKGYLPYSVAKAGLAQLTRALALELAPEVRVNGVAPGAILMPEQAEPGWQERLVRRIPLGRLGDPSDVASAVAWLARAPYVTGQILAVDGGRSVVP
jgi:pteridine reductase